MADNEVIKGKIIAAIKDSRYKWRTPKGISHATGVDLDEVTRYLDASEEIIQAQNNNSKGEPLFTTIEKYKENTGLASRVLSAITNKVVE